MASPRLAARSAEYRLRGEEALVQAGDGLPQVRERHAAAAAAWFSLAAIGDRPIRPLAAPAADPGSGEPDLGGT